MQLWFSPSFPIGSFAYSHGLEWLHETGVITNAQALESYLKNLLQEGSLKSDLILIALTTQENAEYLNQLALALTASSERLLETTQQGNSFVKIIKEAYPHPHFTPPKTDCALPIAIALAALAHQIALKDVLTAFALSFMSNLISVAIRLNIIGQTGAQKLNFVLIPFLKTQVKKTLTMGENDLGSACFYADFASLKHETLYHRIFRS